MSRHLVKRYSLRMFLDETNTESSRLSKQMALTVQVSRIQSGEGPAREERLTHPSEKGFSCLLAFQLGCRPLPALDGTKLSAVQALQPADPTPRHSVSFRSLVSHSSRSVFCPYTSVGSESLEGPASYRGAGLSSREGGDSTPGGALSQWTRDAVREVTVCTDESGTDRGRGHQPGCACWGPRGLRGGHTATPPQPWEPDLCPANSTERSYHPACQEPACPTQGHVIWNLAAWELAPAALRGGELIILR